MGDDRLMYASMTAGTHLHLQRPKVARLCQCSRMACDGLIAIFSVPALLLVLVCVVAGAHLVRDEEVDLLAEFYHLVSIHLPFVLSAPCFFGWTSHIFGCIRSPSTENELFQDTDTYIEKKYENTKGPLMS